MLSLFRRASSTLFTAPVTVQTASFVIARKNREFARATEPTHDDTDTPERLQTTNHMGMDKVTNILDNAALSESPRSDNYSTGPKYQRTRKGRLPRGLHFLKPTDLLVREDPFRRKRALLGPGSAESRRNDWFYQLGIDPLDEATNPRLLSYFVSDMGKVKSRTETRLTWRNQRRLTKAIRRAKMMGVMPILSKQISSYRGTGLL